MSVINLNPPAPSFTAANGAFDFEGSGGNALATALAPGPRVGSDNVRIAPFGPGGPGWGGGGGAGFALPNPQSGVGGIFAALWRGLSNVFAQLMSLIDSSSANAGGPHFNGGEPAFQNATASSTGDPHEAFDGTTNAGMNVSGHWDSMTSHRNLLSSDSFEGGYRVSTSVTQPGANGVTQNARAEVATDAGRTVVAMNAAGAYDVTSFGRHVDLVEGRAVRLDANESVTLNADRSLTIDERNANGASVATTLRSNSGGGVDVNATARNVDLGGYLVTKNDIDCDPAAAAANDPVAGGGYQNGTRPIHGGFVPYVAAPGATSASLAGTFAAQPYDLEEA